MSADVLVAALERIAGNWHCASDGCRPSVNCEHNLARQALAAYRETSAAVPPEPAPPKLDPADVLVREILAAYHANDPSGAFEAMKAVARRALAGTPAHATAPEPYECATCGRTLYPNAKCSDCRPAAGPPTVAPARPAREVAKAFVRETAVCNVYAPDCPACLRWENAVTVLLLRDRASRSPGVAPPVAAPVSPGAFAVKVIVNGQPAVVDVCVGMTMRQVVESALKETGMVGRPTEDWCVRDDLGGEEYLLDRDVIAKPFPPDTRLWIFLGVGMCAADGLQALRGEGPSPAREGMELKSESLGGLDAATVEAVAKELDHMAFLLEQEERPRARCAAWRAAAAHARALATPPGQAK